MDGTTTHRDLLAWQEAMTLVDLVYRDTESFPKRERFGLAMQVRRAAVSVPSNIAEGAAGNSTREFIQFLGIACGSLAEVETQLELAVRLRYLQRDAQAAKQTDRVGKLVRLLRKSLRDKIE